MVAITRWCLPVVSVSPPPEYARLALLQALHSAFQLYGVLMPGLLCLVGLYSNSTGPVCLRLWHY